MFKKLLLYLDLIWQHIEFYGFPTPEEDYYLRIGTIYFKLGKYKKAISILTESEQAHGKKDALYTRYNNYYMGYSYFNLGDNDKAVECFEKYLRLNPSDITMKNWLTEFKRLQNINDPNKNHSKTQ